MLCTNRTGVGGVWVMVWALVLAGGCTDVQMATNSSVPCSTPADCDGGGGSGADGGGGSGGTAASGGMDGGTQCVTPADCGEPGACRVATCTAGACGIADQSDGSACDDGNVCTQSDTCQDGLCLSGSPVVCNGDSSCVAGACVAPTCSGALWFPGPPQQTVGNSRRAMAEADLNGDGSPDLVVVANNMNGAVRVLLNQGNGTFSAAAHYPAGAAPYGLTVEDLNGDGKLDLAVTDLDSDSVKVLLNQGDGTFTAAVSYATGLEPLEVAAVDLNGDGNLDLVVPNFQSQDVGLLLNQGNGSFVAAANYVVGQKFSSVTAADLNGDGRPDLVVTIPKWGADNVSILINQGDGSFAPALYHTVEGPPGQVVAADLNGDGKVDLAVSGWATISVLLNQGNGTFVTASELFAQAGPPTQIMAVDLNADGQKDLVVTNSDPDDDEGKHIVRVVLNHGDGTFGEQVAYASFSLATFVVATDLNSDGSPDLAVASTWKGTVSVLQNQGDGTFAEPVAYALGPSEWLVAGDLNGDGKPDIAAPTGGGVSVLINQGNAVLGAVAVKCPEKPISLAAADLNGDGSPDLAVANWTNYGVSVLFNDGQGSFLDAINYPIGDPVQVELFAVAIADLNGDGKLDLVVESGNSAVTISVLLNQGNGGFVLDFKAVIGWTDNSLKQKPLVVTELNGDGRPDLAVGLGDRVAVLLGNGDGSFAAKVDYPTGTSPGGVAAADLNGDGKTDLAFSRDVGVLLNQGDGTFAAPVYQLQGWLAESITAADLNGDGAPDLVVADDDNLGVLFNQGNGTFPVLGYQQAGWFGGSITVADMNGDGKPDLVGARWVPWVALNQGNNIFADAMQYPAATNANSVAVADFNSDGRVDLAVTGFNADAVSVLPNVCVP